jgi:hypothetical protein
MMRAGLHGKNIKCFTHSIMKYIKLFCFSFSLIITFIGYGQMPGENAKNPYAVSTFECSGIYWKTPEAGPCKIQYKEVKGKAWKDGLELAYDSRDGEYRGSIIKLKSSTEYQVKLSTNSAKANLKLKTRNDNFPVGKTTFLPEGESDKTFVITESGTRDAYHLVTVPANTRSVLNMKNVHDYGIEINADYVIVRGIEIRNARIDGIRIKGSRHNIVIEQCYITFWGRLGGPRTYGNLEGGTDSGIYAEDGTWNLTIQRNLIEDPRGASNDWETGHPTGPQGVSIIQSKGGNVIRYNDIVSTEDHGFNDAIGGGQNRSWEGNMNRDSDIYGNLIRSVWDDAIESEGGNMNVRIWGNYMHFFFNGIATASTSKGPIYMFRNVFGESRRGQRNTLGGSMFKTGDLNEFGGGRRFIFHNTALQPYGVYNVIGRDPNCMTRNNIFNVPGRLGPDSEKEPGSDYDYDYFPGSPPLGQQKNGIKLSTRASSPKLFVSSYKLEFYPRISITTVVIGKFPIQFGDITRTITDPVFQIKNPWIDSGVVLPGFNDDFVGDGPDIGAFEVGSPPLEFGRRAYMKYDEGWAPWEKY